ncbi:hypothetical protein [Kribbella monticola]|uniref:hypothetical protein n=1 Tax=Kribbella monticola TaxID=2185285 RepID=UPI000DD3BFEA|nr:hypothetical protein [Kribbella monticola]
MTTKPNPVLGLLIGAVLAWGGATAINYAGIKLNVLRAARFDNSLSDGLPWILLILAVSAVVGLVLSIRTISGGALVGAGGLLTAVGVAVFTLPLRQAFDLSKLFVIPGTNPTGYVLWDGSVIFVGAILLVLGVRRWATDARSTPQALPGSPGYYQPGQQLPPQYPGQQGARQQDYPPRGGSQPR